MDKNKIIEEFWLNDEVNQAFAKMQPEELQYDLKAEVFLVLLEMDEEKLIGLYERKEIRFYIVRTMLNMIKSDRSKFWKNYRNYTALEYQNKFWKNNSIETEIEFASYIDRTMYIENHKNNINIEYNNSAEVEQNSIIDIMENGIEKLHWYQKEILNLYTFEFNKNAKELSRKTGIPYMSIIRTLKQTKTELKKHIRK